MIGVCSQQSGNSERSSSGNDVMAPLKVDTTGNTTIEGPPTPTHSETQDCIDARKSKCNYISSTFFSVDFTCDKL